ncbi:MAG: GNAT family N-acetyltransferase [Burkholderiaceae bacterium]
MHLPAIVQPAHAGLRIRRHRPGDIGWVISRHAELYAQEYDWDGSFETMVAEIGLGFLRENDPACECCLIAEDPQGQRLGSTMVVRASADEAKLRLVLVEPAARGMGVGSALVGAAMQFARDAGYRRMGLWTNDILVQARRIYERAGFVLESEEVHTSFGHRLVGQYWGRAL